MLVIAICGCNQLDLRPSGPPPRDTAEALDRIDRNFARLQGTIQAPAAVSFAFRDNGRMRRFWNHDGALLFRAPRCLIFNVRSLQGTMAQFGSNDDRYWVWVEPEVRKLWWGSWGSATAGGSNDLPIDPSDLLDVLMLSNDGNARSAVLRVDGADHRLTYAISGGRREVRLLPRPPHLPYEITDYGPRGQVLMKAQMRNFGEAGRGGPSLARHYVIRWPADDAELRIDLHRLRQTSASGFCNFPSRWNGEVEQIDGGSTVGLNR
jgi:hypothetical protein